MSVDFTCGDGGGLAAYLYGECNGAERSAVEAHLAICAACTAELASLGATRSALASWTPPDTELGFQIVSARDASPTADVLRPSRWWQRPLPAWAQAAAALLIFATGGLLGMRAGVERQAAVSVPIVASAPESAPAPGTVATVSADDLTALERRLRREMTDLRATTAATSDGQRPRPVQASAREEQLVQQFQGMLAESEQRQRRELAMRLAQLMRDFDSQRRLDFARIERTLGQLEGVTRPELAEQREMINYLFRTASQRPQ